MITIAKVAPGEDGKHILAKNAISGVDHFCSRCDCPMRRKKSSADNYFFACRSGHKHLYKECLDHADKLVIHDLELTDSDSFHQHIATPPSSGSTGGGGPTGPRGPVEKVEKIVAFNSLKDLWDNHIVKIDNDEPTKNGTLTDIMISSRFAPTIMHNNQSIGPRVLQVKPDYYFWHDQVIRFLMFGVIEGVDHKNYRFKLFDLHISKRDAFEQYVKKIFNTVFVEDSKKRIITPRYSSMLVHGTWAATPSSDCKIVCHRNDCDGKWKCTGHQHAEFTSSRQIYVSVKTNGDLR